VGKKLKAIIEDAKPRCVLTDEVYRGVLKRGLEFAGVEAEEVFHFKTVPWVVTTPMTTQEAPVEFRRFLDSDGSDAEEVKQEKPARAGRSASRVKLPRYADGSGELTAAATLVCAIAFFMTGLSAVSLLTTVVVLFTAWRTYDKSKAASIGGDWDTWANYPLRSFRRNPQHVAFLQYTSGRLDTGCSMCEQTVVSY
jgi:hypothetical protein